MIFVSGMAGKPGWLFLLLDLAAIDLDHDHKLSSHVCLRPGDLGHDHYSRHHVYLRLGLSTGQRNSRPQLSLFAMSLFYGCGRMEVGELNILATSRFHEISEG